MKKLMAIVLCCAVFALPIKSYAFEWGWCHRIFCHLTPKTTKSYPSAKSYLYGPQYFFGTVIFMSQAWRNCKMMYPDTSDPRRGDCQANMGFTMLSLTQLDPVKPLYNPATVTP